MWRFLDASGRQKTVAYTTPAFVTSLPTAPVDGDEIILTDSLSAGTYHWHLRYVAARASNKWVFVGGSPMYGIVATTETSASTAFVDLTTPGPSLTIPVAGDYLISVQCMLFCSTSEAAYMSPKIGAAATVYTNGGIGFMNNKNSALHSVRKVTSIAASTEIKAQYMTAAGGTVSFLERELLIEPIAIGG